MDAFSSLCSTVEESHARSGRPSRVLIGLSGGADSVALLCALNCLQSRLGITLHAIHVNHGLRENAMEDERFCQALCDSLDVPLTTAHVHVSTRGSLEASARQARYQAFEETARHCNADAVALAHHMDDQAETILMHLLYGSGADGLCGMREKNGLFWRPLLSLRRAQLHEALAFLDQSWREDESNADLHFTRNRIRACVMPQLEAISPSAVSAICRAGSILADESELLKRLAKACLDGQSGRGKHRFLMIDALNAQDTCIQRRALRQYASESGLLLDYEQTERLRQLLFASSGACINLPQGWRAMRTKKRLHLLSPEKEPGGSTLPRSLICVHPYAGYCGDGKMQQAIPQKLWEGSELRTRLPGDFIQPFGMQGRKSLSDYLIDHSVDQPFRDDWPLLCDGHEVLWAPGIGASQRLHLPQDAKGAYLLIFSGDLPDTI